MANAGLGCGDTKRETLGFSFNCSGMSLAFLTILWKNVIDTGASESQVEKESSYAWNMSYF